MYRASAPLDLKRLSRMLRYTHSVVTLLALTTVLALGSQSAAQCCPTPSVAYSPVVYQQTTTAYTGWYPGKWAGQWLRNVFGRPTVATTYAASYAPGYTTSYAPACNTGCATPYSVGYAPATSFRTAYRPTYPITYGPLVRTVSRPVVLSPVVSSCNGCVTGCDACNNCGVTQAVYNAPSNCPSCVGGATYYEPARSSASSTPAPSLAPSDNPPAERSMLQKPEIQGAETPAIDMPETEASSDAYWEAPKLFDPQDRTAQNSVTVPIRRAVYKMPASSSWSQPAPRSASAHQVGASGWVSASN